MYVAVRPWPGDVAHRVGAGSKAELGRYPLVKIPQLSRR